MNLDMKVKLKLVKRKTIKGFLWRIVFKYYCLKKSLDFEVPQIKFEKMLFKAYEIDMEY